MKNSGKQDKLGILIKKEVNKIKDERVKKMNQHRDIVELIISRYRGFIKTTQDFDDLIQDGFLGLCEAIALFNDKEGKDFEFYAFGHIFLNVCMKRVCSEDDLKVILSDKQTDALNMYMESRRREFIKQHGGKEPSLEQLPELFEEMFNVADLELSKGISEDAIIEHQRKR